MKKHESNNSLMKRERFQFVFRCFIGYFFLLLFSIPAFSQSLNVHGVVIDSETGETLIGVSIVDVNTKKGVVTDVDGNYSLPGVSPNSTLTFSCLGYESVDVKVDGKSTLNVKLVNSSKSLDELVVVGYGVVRKRDLTSSIAKVDETDIIKTPVTSLDQALQGNAAGVLVINTSAEPGGDISIRVRGGSSILAGNTPLIVVDGFPTNSNDLNALNPSDILSMEVLKDASATAIYGARGANGVIMVTTKKGDMGNPRIDFQSKIHYNQVRHTIPMLDGPLFQTYNNIGRQAMGVGVNTLRPDTFSTRDFQEKLIHPKAIIQDYNISISGGSKQFSYLLSGNVLKQPGLLTNSAFDRYTLRGKFTMEMMKNMNLQVNVSSNNTSKQKIQGGDSGGMMRTLMLNPSSTQKGDFVDGVYIDEETGEILSVNTEISRSLYTQDITKDNINEMNAAFNWEFIKNLTFRTTGSYRYATRNGYYYSPKFIQISQNNVDKNNIADRNTTVSTKWVNENTLTYMNSFNKKHNLTGMIGQSWESSNSEGFGGRARRLEDAFMWDGLNGAEVYDYLRSSKFTYNFMSFFGRVIYNYDNRYLATVTYRADASSRFGANSKWGTFPSISFAWYPTEEKFFPKNNFLSNLKLRLSYGETGNDNIGNYRSWSTLSATNIILDGEQKTGYATNNIGDTYLGWEKTAQSDAGIDIGFFKNRINLTVDVYNKYTNQLLYDYRLPNTTGYSKVSTNIGNILNQGIEFEFSSKNIVGKFKWSTSVNAGFNKGKILDLGGDDNLIAYQMTNTINTPITYLIVGQPLGTFKGYKTDGVYKDWNDVYNSKAVWLSGTLENHTQPGYPKFVDLNGDGIIDENDKTILGHAQPDWTLGFTNSFSYAGFDLLVFFNGAFGNSVVNTNKGKIENFRGGNNNQTRYVLNGYRTFDLLTGNPGYYEGNIPRAIYINSSNPLHSDYTSTLTDYIIEDASYLRLKTISLGYSLPKEVLRKIKLRNCKLQVSAVNLLTWTRYTGMDPESSSSLGDSNTRLGIDQSSYPASRSFVFSLNLGI